MESENGKTKSYITSYRESFHAHYLVNKATVQKVVAFKTSSDINVIEMSLTR